MTPTQYIEKMESRFGEDSSFNIILIDGTHLMNCAVLIKGDSIQAFDSESQDKTFHESQIKSIYAFACVDFRHF